MTSTSRRTLFATEYSAARGGFREAARAAGATLESFQHDQQPHLSCDVAVLAAETPWALVTISGTHGIEGYCAGAIQTHLLHRQEGRQLSGVFQVHVHALNPWGMQSYSRTNEAHVDVNRNIIDFAAPPVNADYREIHGYAAIAHWGPESLQRFWVFHEAFVQRHGVRAWNHGFSGGQYQFRDGIMFGGTIATWSHLTLKRILRLIPPTVTSAVVLDLHSGIGNFGEALLLFRSAASETAQARALRDLSPRTAQLAGARQAPLSLSSFSGLVLDACLAHFTGECVGAVVEFGTYPPKEMIEAILYDRWTRHAGGSDATARRSLLERYCPDDEKWRDEVLVRASQLIDAAVLSIRHDLEQAD